MEESLHKKIGKTVLYLALVVMSSLPSSKALSSVTPKRKIILEELRLEGSNRVDREFLEDELKLTVGQNLSPEFLQEIQLKLYGLGLFKNVLLRMKKSPRPNRAILIVKLTDDPSIIGSWGVGGTLSILQGEADKDALNGETPFGIKTELIARNFLNQRHRGRLEWDIDSRGIYRNIEASYGFPRFSREGVQFDANLKVTDTRERYLDVMGFGGEGSAIWSYDVGLGTLGYGVNLLTNRPDRFQIEGFPKSITAPVFSFERETRLMGFFPSTGYRLKFTLLPSGLWAKTVYRAQISFTEDLWSLFTVTLDGYLQGIGHTGFTQRWQARLDLPFGQEGDQGGLFFIHRYGRDKYEETDIWGQSSTIGLRYHSYGFIAEIGFKIVTFPEWNTSMEGDRPL